jgi:hypothetical protein
MYFTRLNTLALVLAVASAFEVVGKREELVERQSTCSTAGYIPACPGFFKCVPPGAICCDDNISYAMPPKTCPRGTQPLTTAGVVGTPSSITSAPAPPASTQIALTYFTYRITWYYYYYYYTFIAGATNTYSYEVTTISTVSVQATNTAQAELLFKSLSATIAKPTPSQTATSFSGAVPSATPVGTAPTYSKPAPSPSSNGTVPFTGAGSSLSAVGMARWAELTMGALFVVPGLLMVWL